MKVLIIEDEKNYGGYIQSAFGVGYKMTTMKTRTVNMIKLLLLLCAIVYLNMAQAQQSSVTISGKVKGMTNDALPFVNLVLQHAEDSSFVSGTISDEKGLFSFTSIVPGNYHLMASYVGYVTFTMPVFVGSNSAYLNLGDITLTEDQNVLDKVEIIDRQDAVNGTMNKETYTVDENISQTGGSVLQSMQNLPGVTSQDGKLQLRGNDRVVVLIDGKQTAITGFGNQNGLDNLPASAVEKIEIIHNPSAKYDANGNAGIINIVMKKEEKQGVNGKAGLVGGVGALWEKKANLPGIRPQYRYTPKLNPSLSLNMRKQKYNLFLQADNLYSETLNKNEFVTRTYDDGTVIQQQLKRNRNTNLFNGKAGVDWYLDDHNDLSLSGMYSQEVVKDYGDQPFYNSDLSEQTRLWQFLEEEVVTATMASLNYEHRFKQPGHKLEMSFNYTFDRENEKYFFTNTTDSFQSEESFHLIADQTVEDFKLDYTRPQKHGVLETGLKFRNRSIPTNMQFNPGDYSVLDTNADGKAVYNEIIPAVYGTYRYEIRKFDAELGLRVEYVNLHYDVAPGHRTYQSDGYNYLQPFPNMRLTYNLNDKNKISWFYNRRVDRPDEVDIRIFPKYDDAGIIKVGNPALKPQFTQSFEIGYKHLWNKGYGYLSAYHRSTDGTITRIATTADSSGLIYNVTQNAGHSSNSGIEGIFNRDFGKNWTMNLNGNIYYNQINAFYVDSKYPVEQAFTVDQQTLFSGNLKLNIQYRFGENWDAQLTGIYQAPDIIPQGKIYSRYSLNAGIKKSFNKGREEFFVNASDVLNSLVIRKEIYGNGFRYTSDDYYETQVIRVGYSRKF